MLQTMRAQATFLPLGIYLLGINVIQSVPLMSLMPWTKRSSFLLNNRW